MASGWEDAGGSTLESSPEAENLVARGLRSGGLVQVQRAGISNTDQPDIAKSNDGRKETGTTPLKPKPSLNGPLVVSLEDFMIPT